MLHKQFPLNVIAVSFFLLFFGYAAALSAAPITINFSHVVDENTPKGQMALKFKEIVGKKLAGKVVVRVYPKGRLFNDEQLFEALLLDDVQMGAPSLANFIKYQPKLQLYDLPFLFENIEAVDRFQKSAIGQAFLSSFTDRGILGLGYLHNGMKQLSAKKELRVPEDAAGLKFRIQSSEVIAAQFKALNATPVPAIFEQTYSLLSGGAVDGQENTWSNIYSKKLHTLQPNITETNHGIIDYMVVTSVGFWESLPEDIRGEVKKALDEAIAHGNEMAGQLAITNRKAIESSGQTKITVLSKEERQQWVKKMQPVWQTFEEKIGKDVILEAVKANTQ
jgi:C4-dicarboxylate-binding protein DctP